MTTTVTIAAGGPAPGEIKAQIIRIQIGRASCRERV